MSQIDLTEAAKRWKWLLGFGIVMFLLLKTPLGIENNGNRAWLGIEGFPANIQPAEIVKLTFILVLSRQLVWVKENWGLKSLRSIAFLAGHVLLMVGLYYVISSEIWQRTMEQELEQQVADLEKFHNTADGRVQVWFGLRTIFNNTDELCIRTKELADKYGVGIHMHVAEAKEEKEYTYARWGEGTVKHLERLGVLDKNLLAVHTVWLTDEELELFKKREVKISHNPASAMRVLGFARIPKMLAMGLRPSIGTDGASSSNHMDMVDEMWLTSLIHKGWRLDPTVVPSQDILRMATKWGARALLDEDLYGSLECGKKADLIVIDPHGPSMMPVNDKIAALVTAMHSANIQSTMCDGKWLMRDRKILTLDEEAILKEACDRAKAIYKRAGIELPDRFPVVKV